MTNLLTLCVCAAAASMAVALAGSIHSSDKMPLAPPAHPSLESFVAAYTRGEPRASHPLTRYEVVRAFGFEAPEDGIPYTLEHNSSALFGWYGQLGEGWLSLGAKPEQLHIAMTENPDSISVSWTTNKSSTAARVCWRPANASVPEECANGTSWTYYPITVWPWEGMLHTANITGLTPGQGYEYRVFDPSLPAALGSEVISFVAPDAHKDTLLVALGGDMGSYQMFGHVVAQQMQADEISRQLQYDAFWVVGDIAYSTLDPPRMNFEFFWDVYMRQEASFATTYPCT